MPFSKFLMDDPEPGNDGAVVNERVSRIWSIVGAFGKRDPSLFIAVFALWICLTGLSLLVTYDSFEKNKIYAVAFELGLNDNYVGISMLVNALVLIWGLGDTPPRIRASISLVTGVLWMFWSIIVFLGGLKWHIYSASAIWTGLCALALMRSAAVHSAGIEPPRQ